MRGRGGGSRVRIVRQSQVKVFPKMVIRVDREVMYAGIIGDVVDEVGCSMCHVLSLGMPSLS